MRLLHAIGDMLTIVGRAVAATAACFLPRKVWVSWSDRLPVFQMAGISAVLQLMFGFVLGTMGYLQFAQDTASRNNAMLLEIADRQSQGTVSSDVGVSTAMGTSLMVLAALTFMFGTARGLLATYLTATGLFRLISSFVGDPRGDPLLTLFHSLFGSTAEKVEVRAAVRQRRRLEGAEVPDQVVPGDAAGMPRADLVVIASRPKEEWDPGTVIETRLGWFRLGDPEDRETPDGLRTFYPLREVGQAEVFRRVVRYAMPEIAVPVVP
jgi:hypothetical protein